MILYLIVGGIILLVFIWVFRFLAAPRNAVREIEVRHQKYAIEQAKKHFNYESLEKYSPKSEILTNEEMMIDGFSSKIPLANNIEFLKEKLEELNNQIKDLESQPKSATATIKKHALIEIRLEIEGELGFFADNSKNFNKIAS